MEDGRFRFQIRTYRAPGWLVPLMVLAGLAMIPVAVALALGLMAVALGVGVLRALRPGPGRPLEGRRGPPGPRLGRGAGDGAIDVEYEAKDGDEKG
jgi:hypothetical protein